MSNSQYEDLLYEVSDHVAVLTMNRPDKLNALSPGLTAGLAQALGQAQADPDVRVVVLTGAGRGFCAGQDLSVRSLAEGRGLSEDDANSIAMRRYNIGPVQSIARAAKALDKPYIAAVNGPTAGVGMDLASMTDVRYAAEDAVFTTAFARMGIVAGDGGAFYLPRIVGMAKALELLWTSRRFGADEALSMGYVTRVIPTADLMQETLAFAREVAACAPVAVQYIKQLCYQSQNTDLDTALRMAQYMQTICSTTDDALEGPRAFREKRPADFKGR